MTLLIKNGTIVTMNSKREIITGDILVKEDRIAAIGNNLDTSDNTENIIDAKGMIIIPGLVQTHIHLCQVLFRGMADDLELLDWLRKRIWPLEGSHNTDSLYYSSLLGCGELIRGGTTSIIDMGTIRYTDSIFNAATQSGIRYLGGKCMMDTGPEVLNDSLENSLQESMNLKDKWHNQENGRIRYAFCPRFALSCSAELLSQVASLSQQFKIPVHTHASENCNEVELIINKHGLRNINYLHGFNLCNPHLILAHCIHIDSNELDILVKSQTNIVHCPSANLKLASGIAPIPEIIKQGGRVSLGADGAPCNNNLNIFMEMRLASLIHKPFYGPTAMPAETVFAMATLEGAKAMGMEKEIGSLEAGKKADIVLVNMGNWHTQPLIGANVYSQLVYQAQASDVYATIVDGKILMLNGTRVRQLVDA